MEAGCSDTTTDDGRAVHASTSLARLSLRSTWNALDATRFERTDWLCTVCVTVWKTPKARRDAHHTLCHSYSNPLRGQRPQYRTSMQVNPREMVHGETVPAFSGPHSVVDNCVDRAVHPCG